MKYIFHIFCDVYGPRLMNNRHYLPKSKSTAADTRNTKSVLWCNVSFSSHFCFWFFLTPQKEDLECIGFFESAEIQMEPVKCGAWPAFPKDVFSLFSSQ